jgi:hypothetical protein
MPKTLEEIRLAFAKLDPIASGKLGEGFARQWFTKNQWKFEEIDQSPGTLSKKLRLFGGKRPDFLVESHSENVITTVDAKFASTNDGRSFAMPDWEIEKYRRCKAYIEAEFPGDKCEVLFAVFPKEFDGKRLVWVDLGEFDDGEPATVRGSPGTSVSLENRAELWCTNEA